MSYNGTTISKPITITDIKTALGSSRNDVGGLCSNIAGLINPYSLYKPMSVVRGANKTPYTLTDASHKITGLTDADRNAINWGYLPVETAVSASVLKAWCINKTYPSAWNTPTGYQIAMQGGWLYCPPTGGEADPYRMGDFDKYNAKEPTFVTFEAEYEFFTNEANEFSVGGKSLKNFAGVKNKYYGLYIVDANGTGNGLFYSSGKKVADYDGKIDLTIPKTSASTYFPTAGHTYWVFPVLFDTTTSPSGAYPLPVSPYKAVAKTWQAPQVKPYESFKCKTTVTSITGSTSLTIKLSWTVVSGSLSTAYPFVGRWSVEDKNGNSNSGTITNLNINTTNRTVSFIVSKRADDGVTNMTGQLEISVDVCGQVPNASGSGVNEQGTGIGATIDYRSNSDWSQRAE